MSVELSELLVQIQSGDNAVRAPAEEALYKNWLEAGGERPAQLLVGLATLAAQGDPAQRAGAAVILRRCATRVAFESQQLLRVIDQIGDEPRARVRELVLQGMLAPDQAAFTRHKLGDAVAELARRTGRAANRWPGLLEAIAQAASTSPDAAVRETAFRVLGAAPELVDDQPEDGAGGSSAGATAGSGSGSAGEQFSGASEKRLRIAVELLVRGFEDPSEAVRTTAVAAFSAFFVSLPKRTWVLLKPLLPALLNVMEPLRVAHQENELTNVLESLVTLAELAPRMFLPVFGTLVEFTLAVAGDTEFDEAPRMTALELMAAFGDVAPNMCKNEPRYAQQLVPQLLRMLTEVGIDDDDGAEWNNTDDAEQVEEEEPIHREAKLAIDRLALSLGGDVVAPVLFQYLGPMLASGAWRDRVAALMALSNAAEGCRDEMLPELDQILRAVEPLLRDEHPRVQWSACNALGQLSTDLSPEVQEGYGPLILPGLVEKLGPHSVFKVQAHAAAALVNFSDAADQAAMDPFLDDLLTRLLGLVQSPKRYVQEQALTTIAMVADSAQKLFTKYYDTLMPLVLNILTTPVPPEYRLLKAKAIECSTLIALAVGREKFAPHMQQLGDALVRIQQESQDGLIQTPQGEEEDPCLSYLVQSWGRLCRVIGTDFLPYLPVVMPPLLQAAKSTADCHILDVDQAESLRDTDGWEVVQYSGQYLGVHTAVFDEKAGAIELLQVYPRELGGAFWPYVPEILSDVVTPGIKFYYSLGVRAHSCQLVPLLIVAAQQHFNTVDSQEITAVWQPLLALLLNRVLRNERETPGMLAEAFMTIYRAVELIGPAALQPADIAALSQVLTESTLACKSRMEKRMRGLNQPGREDLASDEEIDEFEEEDDEEDEEQREDEEVVEGSNKLVHVLLKTYGLQPLLQTPFSDLIKIVPEMTASAAVDTQCWALEVVGQLAEFGKEEGFKVIEQLGVVPYTLAALSTYSMEELQRVAPYANPAQFDPDLAKWPVAPIVRAQAANAIGKIALFCGAAGAQLALQAVEPLFTLASVPEARGEDFNETTERCTGAIARILRTHGPTALSSDQFALAVAEWLKTLPIVELLDGTSFSYLFLAELLEKKHQVVMDNFDVALKAVVQALAAETLAGKPAEFVIAQFKPLAAQLSQEKQVALLEQLDADGKQVVQSVFS